MIDKVMEVLNDALKQKDLDLWLKEEKIKDLESEVKALRMQNIELADQINNLKKKKDW